MFVDTHAHINDDKFTDKDKIVNNYLNSNVSRVIDIGCDDISSENAKILSEKYPSIYFMAGFQPCELDRYSEKTLDKIRGLCLHDKCVAVGEIGLDYHYEGYNKELQHQAFFEQIKLADEINLPISVHSRDATQDTVNMLKEYTPKNCGVIHCFSGSKETAKIYLDLGFYIAFGGTVTYKNATNLREVASFAPTDRILTETDSPYLAPQNVRGTVNEPKNIPYIAQFLADIKETNLETFTNQIYKNALTLFKKLK